MGLCSKLALFKKRVNWKRTKLGKRKKNKIISWTYFKEKVIIVSLVAKETSGKWGNEKEYWTTKVEWKGWDGKEIKRRRSWKIEKRNLKG